MFIIVFSYRQAQATVLEALPKLKKLQILTKRADDYFAEMAKSDQHMQKVRKCYSNLSHRDVLLCQCNIYILAVMSLKKVQLLFVLL